MSANLDAPITPTDDKKRGGNGAAAAAGARDLDVDNLYPLWIGMGFWVVIIGLAVWFIVPDARPLLKQWWREVGVSIALIFFLVSLGPIRSRIKCASAEVRTALVVFVVLPVILGSIGTIVLLPAPKQILVLRTIFLVVVSLFPALIYYLFIVTRKNSLLNDYFVNLGRLGLLRPIVSADMDAAEAAAEYRVRLANYVQQFEGLYGPLPPALARDLIEGSDPLRTLATQAKARSSSGFVQVFTAESAIPIVAASILIGIGWLLALPPKIEPPAEGSGGVWNSVLSVNEDPAVYAFLGAYFFSLQLLFRRFVREDLRRSAYVAVSMRIVLAVVGTWATVTVIKATGKNADVQTLSAIGFVIGVFPRIAWQFIQGAVKALMEKFGASAILPSMQSSLPVSDLDGLTVWHEARLEEEDVENIPNMASADIIDLMISTRFSPDRIADWVDQAILYTALGPSRKDEDKDGLPDRRENLRAQGILTATSLLQALVRARERNDPEVEKILSAAAGNNIRVFVDAMRTSSNLALVCAWRGISMDALDKKPDPAVVRVQLQSPVIVASAQLPVPGVNN
jgi:hypothetical protein